MNDIDVEYHECSLEDFIKNYDGFSIDWKNSLVMSHVSLMYLDRRLKKVVFPEPFKPTIP